MGDSLCRCGLCGRRERVSLSHCLSRGWPECCGQTMSMLASASADLLDAAEREAFEPVRVRHHSSQENEGS